MTKESPLYYEVLAAKEIEIAALKKALKDFSQLGAVDGNEDNDNLKKLFLYRCPEFIGFLKCARLLMGDTPAAAHDVKSETGA